MSFAPAPNNLNEARQSQKRLLAVDDSSDSAELIARIGTDCGYETKPIMDPRVAYVMTNMMEGVINNGTAAGVRARGFTAPAAGKTGTSHDAWFAGYTSNLLCIVWVGYDDYSDLKIEGAKSAAPIWAR